MKHAPRQLPPSQHNQSAKGIIYVPPPIEQIDQCAKQICQQLGQTIDPIYDTLDTHAGLTAFLKVVADMQAKSLNRQAESEPSLASQKSGK